MWPFVEQTVAQRSSKNRNRGDLVTKTVTCDKVVYRRFLIEKVIPAIRLKWPDRRGRNQNISIQRDGATAHIPRTDVEFNQVANQGVWNIQLEKQPPKSPDTNFYRFVVFQSIAGETVEFGIGDNH